MARAATIPLVRTAGLHVWLADREARALAAGGPLGWSPERPAYHGTQARLAALQLGEPVDMHASDLPPWARAGMVCHWWTRAVVDADGGIRSYDDDGAAWLEENGL